MNLKDLNQRVRSYTRDFNESIYRKQDIDNYIIEACNRLRSIPELLTMRDPTSLNSPTILPNEYHYLIALYSASRCFFQDEQDYRAGTLMNEFELKMEELRSKIENGEIKLKDELGQEIKPDTSGAIDYIDDVYFEKFPYDEEVIY